MGKEAAVPPEEALPADPVRFGGLIVSESRLRLVVANEPRRVAAPRGSSGPLANLEPKPRPGRMLGREASRGTTIAAGAEQSWSGTGGASGSSARRIPSPARRPVPRLLGVAIGH